jgi:MFS transporter, ACS family, hexuronate transporter
MAWTNDFPASIAASPWRWWVCALLLLATTINYLDRVALNQSSSDIKAAFGINDVSYASLESGFQLAFAAGAFGFGFLVDRFGIRSTYVLSVVGWSVSGFFTGYVESFSMMMLCRVSLGFFEAGNWPCGIRTVKQVLPAAERSLGNAIFQSGTGLGAMLTPLIIAGCVSYALNQGEANPWRLPFRVIGAVGLLWVGLWLFTVPRHVLSAEIRVTGGSDESFAAIFRDRRFWVLVFVIIGVNATWHTFRVWLPLFLEKQLAFTKPEMRTWSFVFYALADVGSWLIGGLVLVMTKRGVRLHRARMIAFAVGVILTLASVGLVAQPRLPTSVVLSLVLITGFGALGLFATYFALSQEISAKHQGKISGTLGCINSLFLAAIYPIQGRISEANAGAYHNVLAFASVPAVVALVITWLFWPSGDRHGEEGVR